MIRARLEAASKMKELMEVDVLGPYILSMYSGL